MHIYTHIHSNCVSLHQTSHFFQSQSLLWLVLRPKSQASVHPKLWVLAWHHCLRTWFFSVMHGFCSMHSMPWNPASLQEINNIWQYHIPVYSAQKSTKSNDYKTSMACRNVCEMQRRRQIVRCSNEWVLGFWDANEMSWKNIKSMMWKDQCTYESNEQMETWLTWMNTESLKPWVNGWTNKQTNELKPNRKNEPNWNYINEMKWNEMEIKDMKWNEQVNEGRDDGMNECSWFQEPGRYLLPDDIAKKKCCSLSHI